MEADYRYLLSLGPKSNTKIQDLVDFVNDTNKIAEEEKAARESNFCPEPYAYSDDDAEEVEVVEKELKEDAEMNV